MSMPRQRAGAGIESGRQNDDVELMHRAVRSLDALGRDAGNRIGLDADDLDIGAMEGFEKVRLQWHPMGPETVIRRNQRHRTVWDP